MKPKAIVTDFDGVMTDNRVLMNENGIETVIVNRADGMAIQILKKMGIQIVIMSTETNPVVTARAKKLNIPVLQAIEDKGSAIKEYCKEKKIELEDVMYIGNDINDLAAMKVVGYKIAPNDAYTQVKNIADVVLKTKGGYGVFHEIMELIEER